MGVENLPPPYPSPSPSFEQDNLASARTASPPSADDLPEKVAGGCRGAEPPAPLPLSSSLDTTRTSCTSQQPRGSSDDGGAGRKNPDPKFAYDFRDMVAAELESLWPERAGALRGCARSALHLACGSCATEHYFPFRCNARTCPICAPIAAALLVQRVGKRLAFATGVLEGTPFAGPGASRERGWKFLTLTFRAGEARFEPETLRAAVRRVTDAFPRFWRKTVWGRQVRNPATGSKRARPDTGYVRSIEVSPRGMVHVHLLVHGEFVAQAELQRLWGEVLGEDLAIVHIKAVDGDLREALRETLKYASKGHGSAFTQARHAAAVEYAFQGVHRVNIGGALRKIRPGDMAFEDVTPTELSAAALIEESGEEQSLTRPCEACGSRGPWLLIDFVPESSVALNGGFGVIRKTAAWAAPPQPKTQDTLRPVAT